VEEKTHCPFCKEQMDYKKMTMLGPVYECPTSRRQFFIQENKIYFEPDPIPTNNQTECSKCGKVIGCQNKAQMQDGLYCTDYRTIETLAPTDCRKCLRMPICAIRSSEYEPDCCDSFRPVLDE